MTTLKQVTKNLGEAKYIRWQSENELIVERGVKGPLGWIGWKGAGAVDIRNPSNSGQTFTFTVVATDIVGQWKTNETLTLTPNTHMNIGPNWDDDRHVLNFHARPYDASDKQENNGAGSTIFDDAWIWIQQNIWLVAALIIVFIIILWLTFAGGATALIGAAKA